MNHEIIEAYMLLWILSMFSSWLAVETVHERWLAPPLTSSAQTDFAGRRPSRRCLNRWAIRATFKKPCAIGRYARLCVYKIPIW